MTLYANIDTKEVDSLENRFVEAKLHVLQLLELIDEYPGDTFQHDPRYGIKPQHRQPTLAEHMATMRLNLLALAKRANEAAQVIDPMLPTDWS
jgi:hypothetical protein